MDIFRLLFIRTFRATIPDRCSFSQRHLLAKILERGYQKRLVRWSDWTDADITSAGILLDDLANDELRRELSIQFLLCRRRRRSQGSNAAISTHIHCPWKALKECAEQLHNADAGRYALIDLLVGATEGYVHMFGRMLGLWPFSDVRPLLRNPDAKPVTLLTMHSVAVNVSVTQDSLNSIDQLPGKILYAICQELSDIAPPTANPEWWSHVSKLDHDIISAVYNLPEHERFVFSAVAWGGLRLGQIVAYKNESGQKIELDEVFLTLQSAWQNVLQAF